MMKSKNKFWRKALASFAVGGVLLSGLTVAGLTAAGSPVITDASAGVSGGGSGGGGGGGGGGSGSAYWTAIPREKLNNGSIDNIPAEYFYDPVCQNAVAFYGLVPAGISVANATGGRWTYSFYGTSRDPNSPSRFAGGSDVAAAIANNVGQSWQWGSNYMVGKNFICLDNPNVLTGTEMRYEVRSNNRVDSINENQVHTYTTTVKPQPINMGTEAEPVMKNDPVGADNLKEQATSVLTNYGKVWNDYNKVIISAGLVNDRNLVPVFKKRFADAIAADKVAARAQLKLSENNQAGLAEGGILNVAESSLKKTAIFSTTTANYSVWRCGWAHYSRSGWQPMGCSPVGGTINPDALPLAGTNYARWDSAAQRNAYKPTTPGATGWTTIGTTAQESKTTQQQTGFWQIISAHCNEQGFVDLKKAMGADLVSLDSGDSSTQVSGLMRTKFYAQQPGILPLGDERAATAAQKATSKLSFYDKECPFDCTPDRNGAGATAENGAKGNISKDGYTFTTVKGKYGAKSSDGVNSNFAEIFRDNAERTIRPDVWYPVSTKGVNYDGKAAKTTLVTRWAGGTPTLGTEFNAFGLVEKADGTKAKEPLFDAGKTKQVNQRNFDAAAPFQTATAGQVAGLVKEILVQSTWASTAGKPQALQVAWEYSAPVTSKVPSVVSFTPGTANALVVSSTDRVTAIDGRCWGNYGTDTQLPADKTLATTELRANTGTGADTNFTVANGELSTARNIVLNFVRGTGE